MALLTVEDLKTHLYSEIIAEICRDDQGITEQAIEDAEEEAQAYLSRYDLGRLFGPQEDPPIPRKHLCNIIKDIACWHLVRLANPNVNLELFRTIYEDAIKFLVKVQDGKADPAGWPYKPDDPATPGNENMGVGWSSNPKRHQHF